MKAEGKGFMPRIEKTAMSARLEEPLLDSALELSKEECDVSECDVSPSYCPVNAHLLILGDKYLPVGSFLRSALLYSLYATARDL